MRIRRILTHVATAVALVAPIAPGDVLGNAVGDALTASQGTTCHRDAPTSCAPLVSPSGAPLVGDVEEDGSARYADGTELDATTSA